MVDAGEFFKAVSENERTMHSRCTYLNTDVSEEFVQFEFLIQLQLFGRKLSRRLLQHVRVLRAFLSKYLF